MTLRRRLLVCLAGATLVIAPGTRSLCGATVGEEAKHSYRLSRGDAAVTLQQFAEISGREILFAADAVRGVKTRSVRGRFTALEALQRMLAGTGLRAVPDEQSGALAVCRIPASPADSPTEETGEPPPRRPSRHPPAAENGPPSTTQNNPMKRKNTSLVGAWLSLLVGSVYGAESTAGEGARNRAILPTGVIEGRVQDEVTGRYLPNSRVSIKGTDIRTLTDESGRFILANVPGGRNVVEVLYSGLERKEMSVSVTPGQRVTQNVSLAPAGGGAVKMDPFTVETTKTMQQEMLAINEQRFAPNLKTVVSTGDLTEHGDGNIAEFLKFVPGLSGAPGQRGDIGALSVRGFPSNLTQITQDGADVANAPLSGNTREVELKSTMSITNLARVEVTKVPTPSNGADTMAGSVNLISRSAFEAPRRRFSYTATLVGDHDAILDLLGGKKRYSLWEANKTYFAFPSFNFTYTDPLSSNFGYTISGKYYKVGLPTHERGKTFNTNSATFGSTPQNPLYQSHLDNWWVQLQEKRNFDTTADWRIARNSVLSFGANLFDSFSNNGIYRVSWSAGNNAAPTPASGVRGSHGRDFTIGATGRGQVQFQNNNQVRLYKGAGGNVRYRYDDGNWKADLKTSRSTGSMRYRTTPEYGQMRNVIVQSTTPLRVEHHNIDPLLGPRRTLVFDNSNRPIDTTSADYLLNHTEVVSASMLTFDVSDDVATYNADLRKAIDAFAFPAALQVGAARKTKERVTWNRHNFVLAGYNGPGGTRSPAGLLTPPLAIFPGDDGQRQVVVSPYLAAEAFNRDRGIFYELPANRVNRERERIQREESIEEKVDAFYLQAEARFFDNRLNVLTGVRYEKTKVEGVGARNDPDAVWQRKADGSYLLNAAGNRVRRPEVGASNSLQELPYIWIERGARAGRNYDGYYPSLHLTYNFTEQFQMRAAFAQTYGRPDFSFIIPSVTVNEFTDSGGSITGGRLTQRNPGLLPWSADNYDLTIEYYTNQGGVFSAGVFRKQVVNFFGDVTRESTPQELSDAGVDPAGQQWETRTTINVGNARIDGLELSFNQSLAPFDPWLKGWGRSFRLFANMTKINIDGTNSADFNGFQPLAANWGLIFARGRVRTSLRWNHTGDRPYSAASATLGPNAVNYNVASTRLDVNVSFVLTRHLSVFANLKNVSRVERIQAQRSDTLADHARLRYPNLQSGIATEIGLSGSF